MKKNRKIITKGNTTMVVEDFENNEITILGGTVDLLKDISDKDFERMKKEPSKAKSIKSSIVKNKNLI